MAIDESTTPVSAQVAGQVVGQAPPGAAQVAGQVGGRASPGAAQVAGPGGVHGGAAFVADQSIAVAPANQPVGFGNAHGDVADAANRVQAELVAVQATQP